MAFRRYSELFKDDLTDFFRYGDVLGAAQGWAKSILLQTELRQQFADFFARKDSFTIGVCNGCQLLSRLKSLIPGAESWPTFERNTSEQYEARFTMVKVSEARAPNPSVFLYGMDGTTMPIALSHGEGRAYFERVNSQDATANTFIESGLAPIRYVDNHLNYTDSYPANPNGSPQGIAGISSSDGVSASFKSASNVVYDIY